MGANEDDCGLMVISNKDGHPVVNMGVDEDSGVLTIGNKEGNTKIVIMTDKNSGGISVFNEVSPSIPLPSSVPIHRQIAGGKED